MIHANFLGGLAAKLAGIKNIFWEFIIQLFLKKTKKSTLLISSINAFLSNYIPKKLSTVLKNQEKFKSPLASIKIAVLLFTMVMM